MSKRGNSRGETNADGASVGGDVGTRGGDLSAVTDIRMYPVALLSWGLLRSLPLPLSPF